MIIIVLRSRCASYEVIYYLHSNFFFCVFVLQYRFSPFASFSIVQSIFYLFICFSFIYFLVLFPLFGTRTLFIFIHFSSLNSMFYAYFSGNGNGWIMSNKKGYWRICRWGNVFWIVHFVWFTETEFLFSLY